MDFQGSDMRSGESMRDLFYQSPYLKRFSSHALTPFSNEKHSSNKENISPYSGGTSMWMNPSNAIMNSNCSHSGMSAGG